MAGKTVVTNEIAITLKVIGGKWKPRWVDVRPAS